MIATARKTTRRRVGTSSRRARRQSPVQHTLTGNFRMHTAFPSRFLPQTRNILVYLPPDYETNLTRHYPVFYMHDGQNLFDAATAYIPGNDWRVDETAEELIKKGRMEPAIIVGIYNTGVHRIDEYTPTHDPRVKAGGKADLYGRLIVEELKPFIDTSYRTLPGRVHTALGGSSLGGLVTLYLGLKYSHVFGRLAALSPSLWWDQHWLVRQYQALPGKLPSKIWLDMGTREGHTALAPVQHFRDALVHKGHHLDVDLRYYEAKGARHGERAWAKRVKPLLRFLFPPQK
ncbi:MAG TPA: alpha/beta hydrolase-fold protein [Acidobacteriota bacterium]|nr:alpha/beta hydrolase-fold protein [Acidobacteriota bacterium]HNG93587.1 alpha/beta hydrolase-fold protein [Acidobacteriota bacterium]